MTTYDFIQGGLILLIIACILWIATQIFWLKIQGKMKAQQIEDLFDVAYSKGIRTFARLIADVRKGGTQDEL